MKVVECIALSKTFQDFWNRDRVVAVDKLDLEIDPGEVFGLLGPNGSGKSTTIKMLLGLLYPTSGAARVFGRPPTDTNIKARIGFMPFSTIRTVAPDSAVGRWRTPLGTTTPSLASSRMVSCPSISMSSTPSTT